MLHQRWESRSHFENYLAWHAETGVVDKVDKMLAAPPSVRYLDPVDAVNWKIPILHSGNL